MYSFPRAFRFNEVAGDLLGSGHLDLAERDRNPECRGAVRDVHRFQGLVGEDRLPASPGLSDRLHREQRSLGLHVVNICRIGDPGIGHGAGDSAGDLLDHRRPADVLGQDDVAHGDTDRESQLVAQRSIHPGEHGGVRAEDSVDTPGPHHRDLFDLRDGTCPQFDQDLAKRLVGEDPGEVVDAAVALGLADDGEHVVRGEDPLIDEVP